MTSAEIGNLALGHLNIGRDIANLNENSAEARSLRRFYSLTRDAILRDFDWPFARVRTELELIEEEPNDEWGFSYRYPVDSLMLRRIFSGIRNDNQATVVRYEIGQDSTGSLLYTDMEDAIIRYTSQVTNPTYFPPDFVLAFAARLAAYAAPTLTGGDPFKLGARAFEVYRLEMGMARANAANEERPDQEPQAELIRARDGVTDLPFDDE